MASWGWKPISEQEVMLKYIPGRSFCNLWANLWQFCMHAKAVLHVGSRIPSTESCIVMLTEASNATWLDLDWTYTWQCRFVSFQILQPQTWHPSIVAQNIQASIRAQTILQLFLSRRSPMGCSSHQSYASLPSLSQYLALGLLWLQIMEMDSRCVVPEYMGYVFLFIFVSPLCSMITASENWEQSSHYQLINFVECQPPKSHPLWFSIPV